MINFEELTHERAQSSSIDLGYIHPGYRLSLILDIQRGFYMQTGIDKDQGSYNEPPVRRAVTCECSPLGR